MDFFDSQEKARRKSGWLVVLFFLATGGIVFTVYLLVFFLVLADSGSMSGAWREILAMADVLAVLGGVILAIIGLGTLFKMAQLRSGGAAVAELLGGRVLAPDSRDPIERRVLNVVEEMALASGLPVPPVYLLEKEEGINAFAAGLTPGDAVIGVTKGCAELLTRSELQAVIGHEFSHIFNGDMRLNIRLMSVIHGLIILGLAGRVMLRMAMFGGGRSRDRKSSAIPLFLGVSFMVIGSLGMFFGSLIKAAVSRQREYLADASSVQFTRDAGAMAGALKKIGALAQGSRLENPNAPQASHMYFAQGVSVFMTSLFATHPPLDERIRRIDPAWDGSFPALTGSSVVDERSGQGPGLGQAHGLAGEAVFAFSENVTVTEPASLTASIGRLDEAHVIHARDLRRQIPGQLMDAAHDPGLAPAVVFSLLLDSREDVVQKQTAAIEARYGRVLALEVSRLAGLEPNRMLRLPLVDMCFPALRLMPFDRYPTFKATLRELIKADGRIGVFEWALHRAVLRHLDPLFKVAGPRRLGHASFSGMRREVSLILSALAHVGASSGDAQAAFALGAQTLNVPELTLRPRQDCGIQALDQALNKLNTLKEKAKRDLITACAAVVAADGFVNAAEGEVLRAVSDALECPMPPVLPGLVPNG